jgi:hypothetical protein
MSTSKGIGVSMTSTQLLCDFKLCHPNRNPAAGPAAALDGRHGQRQNSVRWQRGPSAHRPPRCREAAAAGVPRHADNISCHATTASHMIATYQASQELPCPALICPGAESDLLQAHQWDCHRCRA